MASRLIPLLIAALAAAAIGCGGSDANESRRDARASAATSRTDDTATSRTASAATSRTASAATSRTASAATSRTKDAAHARSPFAEAVPGSRATVWAVGDSAGGPHAAPVAQLIRKARPDKDLYLGDIFNGTSGFPAYRQLYGGLPLVPNTRKHYMPHLRCG